MSSQLERWTGQFGEDYTNRNIVNPASRVAWFRKTLAPLNLRTILEVGCNRGHNLDAIDEALDGMVYADGVEPADYARRQAQSPGRIVYHSAIYTLPPGMWDLAFTSGVLIHVPPDRLDEALRGMYRVARRYLLAIEYAGDGEAVEYRGHQDMLWKRDYGAEYLRVFPDLVQVGWGDLEEGRDGFKDARWWLLEKPQP